MELEKRTYYINLFDIYKNLLTEKQVDYFESYYLEDFTLKEISENYNISRNAVFDQVKKVINILENFENNLNILKKNNEIKNILEKDNFTKEEILSIIEE